MSAARKPSNSGSTPLASKERQLLRPSPTSLGVHRRPCGIIQGPPTKRVDFSLFKNIDFREEGKVRLQLRAEAFNVFNRANFRNLSGTSKIAVTSATFGQIQRGSRSAHHSVRRQAFVLTARPKTDLIECPRRRSRAFLHIESLDCWKAAFKMLQCRPWSWWNAKSRMAAIEKL